MGGEEVACEGDQEEEEGLLVIASARGFCEVYLGLGGSSLTKDIRRRAHVVYSDPSSGVQTTKYTLVMWVTLKSRVLDNTSPIMLR